MVSRTHTPTHPTSATPLNSRPNWNRLDGVDVLRGLAIFFVALNHVHMRLAIAGVPYVSDTYKPLIGCLVWNGQFGVQIFFAVSGFLIASTSLRRWGLLSNLSLRDFYLLRIARIVPMLLRRPRFDSFALCKCLALRRPGKIGWYWPRVVGCAYAPREFIAGAPRLASR